MRTKRLSGFILKYHSFLEAHKVITLFTKEEGKVSIVAYGVRSPKSKQSGSFELLNEVSLLVFRPYNRVDALFSVKECNLELSLHRLREDYNNINNLYYIAEFIGAFVQEKSSDNEMYNLLKQTVQEAIKKPSSFYLLTRSFQLKSLAIFGFLASFKYCSKCSCSLIKGKEHYKGSYDSDIYISSRAGFIFCISCKNDFKDIMLSMGAYKVLSNLFKFEPTQITNLTIDKPVRRELNKAFDKLINSIIGKSLTTSYLLP